MSATVCLAVAALATGALAQEPVVMKQRAPDRTPDKVELLEPVVRVPFVLAASRPIPVVEARVNGKGPFRFFLDTGAAGCVFDKGFAAELGLEKFGTVRIGDPSGNAGIEADRYKVDVIEMGAAVFAGVKTSGMDRTRFGGNEGIRGVLGLPLFASHLLTVDYAKSEIVVSSAALPLDAPGVVAYDASGMLPKIELEVGGHRIATTIDTGAPSGITLPASVVAELTLKSEPVVVGRGRTVNSEFDVVLAQLDGTLMLAGHAFVDPEVHVTELFPHANLGYQVLKDFELSIDQKNHRVRFASDTSGQPIPAGAQVRRVPGARRSLGVMIQGGGMTISRVIPGSLAEKLGIRVGDRIARVNGASTQEKPEAMMEALKGTAEIRIELVRDGKKVEVVVPKVD